jgi:hypothetical protein
MKTFNYCLVALLLAAAGLVKAQETQTIRGKITDDVTKAPIIGAVVLLVQDSTAKAVGAVTDENGNFRIANVPLGRKTLKISNIGYEPRMLPNIIVTAGKEVVLDITMTESLNELAEAVVEYSRKQDKRVTNNEFTLLSARAFNIDDTKRYAGALGDPSRMAANFAGVVAGNDARNDIVVRGNSPTGMLWQLEGMNIPNPNHFGSLNSTGGPVSMLNNNNLAKSDFMTSAFPAQYGNALAGVFDLGLRNGNNEKREYVGQIGFNGFEVGAEGPFSGTGKGSYLVNYRYSTLTVFNKLGINFGTGTAVPNYQDINYKVNLPVGDKGKFTLFGIAGRSDVKFLGNDADTTMGNLYANENENTIVDYRTGIFGANYEHRLSDKTFGKVTVGYTATDENFLGDSISTETRREYRSGQARFTTQKWSVVSHLQHKMNRKNTFAIGTNIDFIQFGLLNRRFIGGGAKELVHVDVNGESVLSQAYAMWKHRFSNRLTFNAGMHFQHYTQGNAAVAEPRASLKYLLDEKQSLAIGYGWHNQIQPLYTYHVQTMKPEGIAKTNQNLGFTANNHSVITYELLLPANFSLKADAYYQRINRAPVTMSPSSFSALNTGADFGPSNKDSLINKGLGENYGIELTIERSFSDGFFLLATASVFDSKYRGSDGVWRNSAYNTGYVVNLLSGKEFKVGKSKTDILGISLKGSTIGGRFLTPIDLELSKERGQAVFIEEKAFSERQQAYFRTDVKIYYRKEYKKSTLEYAIDLQNVTNHQNVFRQDYNRRTNSIVTEYQQGFFPVPFVRYTF